MHFRFIFMTAAEVVARWAYIPTAFDPSYALVALAVSTVLEKSRPAALLAVLQQRV